VTELLRPWMLLGMSIEREWPCEEAYDLVTRAGPYLHLWREDFDSVIAYLAGTGKVLGSSGAYGKIVLRDGKFRVTDQKTARQYYMNVGVISTDYEMKIVSVRNKHSGEVEEAFIASLQPDEAFIMGGRPVRVKYTFQNTAVVEPAKGETVKTPRWMGNEMALTAQLALEESKLRGELRAAWDAGGESECKTYIQKAYKRPSPFGLPLFAAFSREVLLAADPDRALDDFIGAIYDDWR
jgi:Lhr-like helicase